MKRIQWALGAALASLLTVTTVFAQDSSQLVVDPISADYYQLETQGAAAAVPVSGQNNLAEGEVIEILDLTSCDGCGNRRGCWDPCTEWKLFEGKTCHGIEVGGWVSAGITWNAHGNTNINGNSPMGFNNTHSEFMLNQLWIYAEKAVDTGGCGTDWGFRIDYVFGADGPDTQAFGDQGWDFDWNTGGQYGSAIPQIYFEYGYNDLKVKFGHFYTLIGNEVVQAPDNFFYSHAYTMYYGEPFTHTGFLAEYAYADDITLYGGWSMGWDSGFDNHGDGSTFIGGVSWQLNDCTSIAWMTTFGDFGDGSVLQNGGNAAS
ncbi:MAG: porin, partial [Pirellulaceae bacterium]|nr:porin [Pirellulaceae bacterium]